jgi:hypothetical protein
LLETVNYDWKFSGAQAGYVSIFPISPQVPVNGIIFVGNRIHVRGVSKFSAFLITESINSRVENNIFDRDVIEIRGNVSLGNGSNSAGVNSGYLDNTTTFKNNRLINTFILLNAFLFTPGGSEFTLENNIVDFAMDRGLGGSRGIISSVFPATSNTRDIKINGLTVNINQTFNTGDNFSFFMSENSDIVNMLFEDVVVNYTGTFVPVRPFMLVGTNNGVDLLSSTQIINSTLTGTNGIGTIGKRAVNTTGVLNPTITNSTAITVQ